MIPSTISAILSRRSMVLAALSVASTLGCAAQTGRSASNESVGTVEVTLVELASSCAEPRPLTGDLELRSFDERVSDVIPGDALAQKRSVRRTLPAGLYSIAWQPTPEQAGTWSLRNRAVLSVFAGKTTPVEVRRAGDCGGELARRN